MSKLYLIPSLLGDNSWENDLPASVRQVCLNTKYFIVENIRSARRFLKKLDKDINIDGLTFFELNKYTSVEEKQKSLVPLLEGHDTGIISEAGCPGVADPGADIVRMAHQKNIQVVPLTGPSSIILALMASGLNGQNFVFLGYLPVKQGERIKKIRETEQRSHTEKQTQIFIETPYRNNQLTGDLLNTCHPSTLLCIACDLTTKNEYIATKTVGEWKGHLPDMNKRPAIFLLSRE